MLKGYHFASAFIASSLSQLIISEIWKVEGRRQQVARLRDVARVKRPFELTSDLLSVSNYSY